MKSLGPSALAAVLPFAFALVASCGSSADRATLPPGADRPTTPDPAASAGPEDGATDGDSGPGDAGADADASIAPDAGAAPEPLPCTRAAAARPAPASLYDVFKRDMSGLSGAARTARVEMLLADIAAKGGTPLEDAKSDRAVFLAHGAPPSGAWSVVGSFVGWDKTKGLPMSRVADTDLWVADTASIASGASHSYKLLSGQEDTGYAQDALAKNVAWDGVYRGAATEYNVGQFNAIVHARALPTTEGRLVVHGAVRAAALGNERKVYVYLPPNYDDGSCSALPTILFNDGNDALTRGDYAHIADGVYSGVPALSAILVFAELASPSVPQRVDEYSFGFGGSKGVQYIDFLARELWTSVKARYRVCTRQEARGLSGVSLGGLVATFAAFEKPSEWGWVGAQSASYWWNGNALITRAQTTDPKIGVRFYLDSTDKAPDNSFDVDAMAAALASKAYDHARIKSAVSQANPHDWPFFKARAAGMLTHFRQNQGACN